MLGEAENDNTFKDPVEAVKALRNKSGDPQKPVSDQFLESFVIVDDDNKPVGTVEDGDAVVIFNFRADRVVQLSKALEYEDFKSFDRCATHLDPLEQRPPWNTANSSRSCSELPEKGPASKE